MKTSIKEQKKVWDAIAPEWHEYKKIPSEFSKEFLKKQKGNILDLGSGSGRHLLKFKEEIELKTKSKKPKRKYYLQDFSDEMIKLAEKKAKQKKISAEFTVSPMTKIPYKDNFFDAAISISAIHCTPKKDHKKIIKEFYRVLKPKAKALIGVWNVKSKRFKRAKGKEKKIGWTDKGERYYYLFDEEEIHNLFKDVGFKIISSHNSEMMINFVVTK
ncbi:class I SAM-dependent methyltransferase [archaeon]|jgi:ubiquinone/menaquinone biosynthesis C-methylase UbiE|nr:class I SAM-dependent methyltransferase [archaeon]MBT4374010.1 class I SAM-dependent methyltransferase [archaeon]MBT4532106.1 class I SAM-dependent methyltransferase [archaeon]MBT7001996.1 class I SAM-dependent methyltransferase [archaeon]MBT7282707.1 class I SAM-dependent methyltransferase [archaeon]